MHHRSRHPRRARVLGVAGAPFPATAPPNAAPTAPRQNVDPHGTRRAILDGGGACEVGAVVSSTARPFTGLDVRVGEP